MILHFEQLVMCNEPEEVSRIVRDLHSPRRDIIYLMIYIFFFSFKYRFEWDSFNREHFFYIWEQITFERKVKSKNGYELGSKKKVLGFSAKLFWLILNFRK